MPCISIMQAAKSTRIYQEMRTWICLFEDRGILWKVIDNVSNKKVCAINTETSDSEFYQYFKDFCISQLRDNCNVNYEANAISFINEYDTSAKIS